MLYHFTSCEAILKIILSDELRFSRSMNLDDPFERMRHRKHSDWDPSIPKEAPAYKYIGYFNSRVDQTNILCFFDDVNNESRKIDPLTDLKMWSHYGKSHKGCCIVVDKEKIIKAFEKYSKGSIFEHGRVEYNNLDNYQHVTMSVFDGEGWKDRAFSELFHNLFFNKATYYSGENEYRFVINNKNQNFALKIRSHIKKIAIAENTPAIDQKSIIELCKLFNLEVGKMMINNDEIEYRKF